MTRHATPRVQIDVGTLDEDLRRDEEEELVREEEDVDQLDAPPVPVTRQMAIDAIVAEVTWCSPSLAAATIDWLDAFVSECRSTKYGWAYPTTAELQSAEYRVFDSIWPHAETPQPGTAGDTVTKHLLHGNETGIWHDMLSEGGRSYCGVTVLVGSV